VNRKVDVENSSITVSFKWEDETKPAAISWSVLFQTTTEIGWHDWHGGILRVGVWDCDIVGADAQNVYVMKRS